MNKRRKMMKRLIILVMGILFVFAVTASAEVTVLKTRAVIKVDWENQNNTWENVTNDAGPRMFLIIDADAPTVGDDYTVNYLEIITYWNDNGNKEYERVLLSGDPDVLISLVDLRKHSKVALVIDMTKSDQSALMSLTGKVNGNQYIKFLKGFLNTAGYDISGAAPSLKEFETLKMIFQRTKAFHDPTKTGSEIADDVATFLENRGFVENTTD
jgi:hypothetical protein